MPRELPWQRKFAVAISGLLWSFRREPSFLVHLPIAMAVIMVAAWLKVEPWRWALLVTSIAMVISAELFNTSIEQLVKVFHREHHQRIGRALDVAAGAVLFVSLGAVAVGLIVLGPPLWDAISESF